MLLPTKHSARAHPHPTCDNDIGPTHAGATNSLGASPTPSNSRVPAVLLFSLKKTQPPVVQTRRDYAGARPPFGARPTVTQRATMAPAASAASPATVVHAIGSKVFVHDADEGWCKGEVVAFEGASLVVKTERGETRAVDNADDAPLQNADSRGVEVRIEFLGLLGAL